MFIKISKHHREQNKLTSHRIELLFTPILIIVPIFVSIFLFLDWFYRGFAIGISIYDGELVVAMIILIGNIIFYIPFLKSFTSYEK